MPFNANRLGLSVDLFLSVFGRISRPIRLFLRRLGLVFQAIGVVLEGGFARALLFRVAGGEGKGRDQEEGGNVFHL